MRMVFLAGALAVLSGCAVTPALTTSPTNNTAVTVEKLFDHEGCSVYRFRDGGVPRYFAKCQSTATASTAWDESCGKNCVRAQGVTTTMVPP